MNGISPAVKQQANVLLEKFQKNNNQVLTEMNTTVVPLTKMTGDINDELSRITKRNIYDQISFQGLINSINSRLGAVNKKSISESDFARLQAYIKNISILAPKEVLTIIKRIRDHADTAIKKLKKIETPNLDSALLLNKLLQTEKGL